MVTRNDSGGAGFAFDRDSMKITSRPKDGKYPAMQVGDVIVAVNGDAVGSLTDYNRLARGNQEFRLSLQSGGSSASSVQRSVTAPRRQRSPAPAPQPCRSAPKARPKKQARAINTTEWDAMALDIDNMTYEQLLAFEEQQGAVVKPGLQDAEIDGFPIEQVCGGGNECAICLEDFCDGEQIMRLPCMHTFHSCCSRDWLRRQAKCPFCNFDLKI